MKINHHLLFVHIPKTAGTSFRLAAKEFYGEKNVFFDYTPEAGETSKEIIEIIYKKKDLYKFYRQLKKRPSSFLSGHFPASKYAMLYDAFNIISFVRDPLKQIISHYNHYKKHLNYTKSLSDFIMDQRFQNLQSRLLSHSDIGMYGFLGITEQYNTSIEIFNTAYHTNLKTMHKNKIGESFVKVSDLNDELIEIIYRLNEKDMKFYKMACKQFEIRKKLHENNKPFTHGMIQIRKASTISGYAFRVNSQKMIRIEIYHNNQKLTTVIANLYKKGLLNQGVPRKGFIGFRYQWEDKNIDIKNIRCIVKDTGQEIL